MGRNQTSGAPRATSIKRGGPTREGSSARFTLAAVLASLPAATLGTRAPANNDLCKQNQSYFAAKGARSPAKPLELVGLGRKLEVPKLSMESWAGLLWLAGHSHSRSLAQTWTRAGAFCLAHSQGPDAGQWVAREWIRLVGRRTWAPRRPLIC